jgi:phosphoenolpyruvate synthase/pyruvate phosphate dikinase
MGFPTKVQLIKREKSEQWYINFPSAVAQAMEFGRGETVEWFIEDKETLVLQRPEAPARKLKKKPQDRSSAKSKASSKNAGAPSGKSAAGSGAGGSC